MPTFAAVDIGSNSVRLKIARQVRTGFDTIHEDREVTRLGASVFRTGVLEPAAIDHTVRVLQRFYRATQQCGVDHVRVVATSALRDARHSGAFVEMIHSATGWNVEIISGLDEGRLIHLGIVSNIRVPKSPLLLIDLGGGSCELTLSQRHHIREIVSLPIGAVRLTEEFVAHDPPKKKEIAAVRGFIAQELERVAARFGHRSAPYTIATSGTAAALWEAWQVRNRKPVTSVSHDGVEELAATLAKLKLKGRKAFPGVGPRRAEIIVPGAYVFAEIMRRLHITTFRYSRLGLRDGLLAQMRADFGRDRSGKLQRQIETDRADALREMAARYQVDRKRTERIRHLTLRLFGELKSVHRLPPDYSGWLSAAAQLHEVGTFVNRTGRHRHAHYIIANSDLLGFTFRQRRLIAAIARFVGKSSLSSTDRAMRLVHPDDRESIPPAVALLRIARALDQSRKGVVRDVRARVLGKTVALRLATRGRHADVELWALDKERAYFRDACGFNLEASL